MVLKCYIFKTFTYMFVAQLCVYKKWMILMLKQIYPMLYMVVCVSCVFLCLRWDHSLILMPSTSSTNPFSTRLSLCISLQLFFKSVDMDGRFAFCKTKLYYILSCHVMFKINLSWCMWKTLSCFLWSAQDINLNTWETWASTSILGRLGHQPQYLGDLDTNLNTWEDWTSTSILGRPGHQPQYLGDLDINLSTWESNDKHRHHRNMLSQRVCLEFKSTVQAHSEHKKAERKARNDHNQPQDLHVARAAGIAIPE